MTKKIAIIGSAPSSVGRAPYQDPSWEIWGCSPGVYTVAPRTNRWFELHRWTPEAPWFGPQYAAFVENYPGPVYMATPVETVKNCTLMPVGQLLEKFGPYFFTSTVAWMLAMAIEEGADEIGLWGVDMSHESEYGYQRAGCQYMAMIAKARGIHIHVPPESDVLRPPPLYGLCEVNHDWIKTRERVVEIQQRITALQQQQQSAGNEVLFLQGALNDLQHMRNTWLGGCEIGGYTMPPPVGAAAQLAYPLHAVPDSGIKFHLLDEEEESRPA